MAESPWKEYRYRLEWVACAALARGIPRLPRRACVVAAQALGWLAFYLDRKGRAVALANLGLVFGKRFSEAERKTIARGSYQNFARTVIDLFWAPRLTAENWRDYIEMAGESDWLVGLQQLEKRQGVVSICIHWGNFEWASHAFGFLGFSVPVVTETFKNERLSSLFSNARASSGHLILPQENSMIRLLKSVKRGGFAGMLADLTLRPDQPSAAIDAFGHKMCVTILHSILVQRGGALIVPVHGEPLPGGRVRVVIDRPLAIPPGASARDIAQLCWDHFEPRIQERPELWMWAYKHWRYRPADARPEDYPFYANPSTGFENLLQP